MPDTTPPADPFKISAIVPDFAAQVAEYKVASQVTRDTHRHQLDIPYGKGAREKLNLFFPEGDLSGRPVHMFLHGGYWRANVKDDYDFVAEGVIAAGAIAAIVEYTLMPGARMAQLVSEVRQAAAWLAAHAGEFGGDGAALSASGHSAGAHLCSYLGSRSPHEAAFPTTPVKSLLMLSGIYDLRPITTSFLQPELQLTPEEVAHWSPFDAVPAPGTHFEITVGHEETQPFHIQAQDYAFGLEQRGASVERVTLPGHEHMSIVRELGRPGKPMVELLSAAIARSRN